MTSDARVGGEVLGDAELIAAVRGGESAAFAALYERHAGAALVVARQYSTSVADAEDVVSEAFTKVFSVFQYGGGPDVAFRAYLFTVVRRLAMTRKDGLRRVAPTDDVETLESGLGATASTDEPAMAGFERSVVSRAYATLPERWQAVLWYTEVESLTPAQIAPLLGLTANGVAALSYRAREGLRQAYLQEHLQAPPTDACRPCADKLGAYVRGGLARRETAQVQEHLDSCGECRALLLELGDVNHGMRTIIAPLVLGLAGLAALAHGLPLAGGLAAGAGAGAGAGGGATAGGAAGSGAAGSGAAGNGAAWSGAAAESGAAASGSAAAGTAAAGGAATAAASSGSLVGVGAAASGAAASGGLAAAAGGGLFAFVGSLSGAAIAAVVTGVIVVGGLVTAGALGLLPGTGGAPQAGSAAAPVGGAAVPGSPPTSPSDGTLPSDPPTAPTAPTTTAPTTTAPILQVPASLTGPTGTSTPTAQTTPTPAPPTEPILTPASIAVASSQLAVELSAGATQSVSIGLQNTGQASATNLVATLTLPAGVSLASSQQGAAINGGAGRSVRFGTLASAVSALSATSATWTCATSATDPAVVTCRLAELPGGQVTHLSVTLDVVKTAGGDGAVALDIDGVGIAPTRLVVPAHVAVMPANLVVTGPPAQDVMVAEPHPMSWTVSNVGGQTATALSLTIAIPDGLSLNADGVAGSGWTCVVDHEPVTYDSSPLTCSYPSLAPDKKTATLDLTAVADARVLAAASPRLAVRHALTWTGSTSPSAGEAILTAVPGPAELTIAEVPSVRVVVGGTATVLVPWHNVGGSDAVDVLASVTLPLGVHGTVSIGTGGIDGTCTVTPASGAGPGPDVWTCTVPRAAAGADGVITLALTADQSARGAAGLGVSIDLTATDVPAATGTTPVTVSSPVLGFGTPAPLAALSAGRSGTVAFTVTNSGDAVANHVVAQVGLPAGVAFDAGLVGATSCSTFDGIGGTTRTVTCALGSLAAGAAAPVVIGLTASTAGVSDLPLTIQADGLGPVEQNLEARIADAGLSPRYTSSAGSDVTEIGAPLLTCTESAGCTDVLDGTSSGNNNSLAMVPLNVAGGTQTSSSSTLTIPEGRTVTFAGLYWSANAGPAQTFDAASLAAARLRGPGDTAYRDVTGAVVSQVTDDAGRSYYQSFADVTSQVAAGGSGSWSVADVALPTGRVDPSPTYYAGWALVVVYSGGTGNVTVYDGGAWVASNSSVPFAFQGAKGQAVRLGVVAWEGDQSTAGDTLRLNGAAMTPLRWDPSHRTLHPGSTTNAFDSTAVGSAYVNSLGVDAKGFASASLVAGVNTVVASTSGDQYLIGALTVTTAGAG